MITVRIKVFSYLKDKIGESEFHLVLTNGSTVNECIKQINSLYSCDLSQEIFRIAINQSYQSENVLLNDGDELAFIPPVSGG